MRPLLLLVSLLLLALSSFSQDNEVETYLVVRLQKENVTNPYYTINAEPFNNNALDIYELVSFSKNYFVPKKGVHFYYNRTDSTTRFYNYFKSETEALDFIGSLRWQLVTVISEIYSDPESLGVGSDARPYTMVRSQPVYYFRKKVIPLNMLRQ